jgi:hypothetical protein
MDSFESYDPSDLPNTLHRVYFGYVAPAISQTYYKTGTQSLTLGYDGRLYTPVMSFSNNRVITGFHFYRTVTSDVKFLGFSGPTLGQCYLAFTSQKVCLYRWDNTLLATGTTTINIDTWYHLEAKITVSDSTSAGDCIVKINGNEDINLGAGNDTRNFSSEGLDVLVFIASTTVYSSTFIDNLFILNDSGSINNDFIGECLVECKRPDGNGSSSQWDGSDGNQVDNYLLVDEQFVDESDYLEAQNSGELDLFDYGDISVGVSVDEIYGVGSKSFINKLNSGSRRIRQMCRSGGSNYNGDDLYLPTGVHFNSQLWETDPDTAALWTKTNFNSAQFGIKVSA